MLASSPMYWPKVKLLTEKPNSSRNNAVYSIYSLLLWFWGIFIYLPLILVQHLIFDDCQAYSNILSHSGTWAVLVELLQDNCKHKMKWTCIKSRSYTRYKCFTQHILNFYGIRYHNVGILIFILSVCEIYVLPFPRWSKCPSGLWSSIVNVQCIKTTREKKREKKKRIRTIEML